MVPQDQDEVQGVARINRRSMSVKHQVQHSACPPGGRRHIHLTQHWVLYKPPAWGARCASHCDILCSSWMGCVYRGRFDVATVGSQPTPVPHRCPTGTLPTPTLSQQPRTQGPFSSVTFDGQSSCFRVVGRNRRQPLRPFAPCFHFPHHASHVAMAVRR